jgi:hypothetical protein
MAETQALAGAELRALLKQLATPRSLRKMRLAACACCRRAWWLLVSERSRRAVALAERRADGLADESRLESAYLDARKAAAQHTDPARQAAARLAAAAADPYLRRPNRAHGLVADLDGLATQSAGHGPFNESFRALVADVVGPPDRPDFNPEWRTATVVSLVRRVLEERDELAMLVLADAVEEAGCDDDELLAHCRGPGPHARGCWVMDLLLEKG